MENLLGPRRGLYIFRSAKEAESERFFCVPQIRAKDLRESHCFCCCQGSEIKITLKKANPGAKNPKDNIMVARTWNLLDQSAYPLLLECQNRGGDGNIGVSVGWSPRWKGSAWIEPLKFPPRKGSVAVCL